MINPNLSELELNEIIKDEDKIQATLSSFQEFIPSKQLLNTIKDLSEERQIIKRQLAKVNELNQLQDDINVILSNDLRQLDGIEN